MATIINNNTTNGKYRVRASEFDLGKGNPDFEQDYETLAEAQTKINQILAEKIKRLNS